MKKITYILTTIALMAWACPAVGQSSDYGKLCQFFNIDKTVKAKLGEGEEGEDVAYQQNTITALWPVTLNGKECPKLQKELCYWLTGKEDITQLDRAVENVLYTDNEGVSFGDNGPYIILDSFEGVNSFISFSSSTIELKSLGNRFATFHLFFNMYYAGAAHGMYCHQYMTYDTQLDKIVKLEDVIIDPELIRPHILESINLKYDYSEEELFLPEDKIPQVPSVFYFEDGFLHLVYQVYEIASYAQGDIDVPIFYPDDGKAPEYLTPYGKEIMEESLLRETW